MKWFFLENNIKVAKYNKSDDIRTFSIKGYQTYSDLLDYCPITNKHLSVPQWYIFKTKK